MINMGEFDERPSIAQYFAGKTVALTGATGFIGHCLIEKLLRSCPDVKKVYLFIRKKRNMSSEERLNGLIKLPIFDQLREIQPDFACKLNVVPCDLEKPDFAVEEHLLAEIKDEVNIFFHSAATLRFNEHLRLSYQVNTTAVRTMLEICRGIKHLEALVHISTAYSFCNQRDIGEVVYKTGWDFDKLHDSMEWMTDDMITKLTPDILKDRPNTYTLTKAFGEEVIVREGMGLPLCIVRPSIVGAIYSDPIPGWCSNLNGSTGLFMAYGKGLLQTLMVDLTKSMDIVPSDFVVSGTIAAAWRTGTNREQTVAIERSPIISSKFGLRRSCPSCDSQLQYLGKVDKVESSEVTARRKSIPIYHLVSSNKNPVTLGQWKQLLTNTFNNYPLDSAFQLPKIHTKSNKYVYWMTSFLREYIPAYIFDAGRVLLGQKPKLLRLTQRMGDTVGVLQYFLVNGWNWADTNVDKLQSEMTEEDKKIFNFDARTIHWSSYMNVYAKGLRKYMLKEDLNGYPAARRHIQRLRVLGYLIQASMFLVVWRLLVSRTGIAQNLWHLFMSLWFKFLHFFQISSTLHRSSFFSRIFA